MGIDYKCPYMNDQHGQILSKRTVNFFCEKKGHSIKSCSGCKVEKGGKNGKRCLE